jgi:hypothetical protein
MEIQMRDTNGRTGYRIDAESESESLSGSESDSMSGPPE